MQSQKKWLDQNGKCSYGHIPQVTNELPKAVYELNFDEFRKEFFLEKISDSFELPEKIYNIEHDLINRVIKTFTSHSKNFGVLLKGLKGTGKTITSKIISNTLNIPVILINKPFSDMGNFINSINQDIILLFDEFEKVYKFTSYEDENDSDSHLDSISNLLTLMDGVFTTKYKRLFILTTNKEWLPDPLLARPSRIRYIKDFSDTTLETVETILNDLLIDKQMIPELMTFIKELEIISVDIVKSIAEEANLYQTSNPDFFDIFNVKRTEEIITIYKIVKGKEVIVESEKCMDDLRVGRYINGEDANTSGRIVSIDKVKNEIKVKNIDNTKKVKIHSLFFKKVKPVHYMFRTDFFLKG